MYNITIDMEAPVLSSGVVEATVGLRVVEEGVETALEAVEGPFWERGGREKHNANVNIIQKDSD